ncbi:MAG: prenyltransferase [Acidilobaceae archaeon]|nr:prenyltransferase [Acidilobaceae archaeon]MDW7974861.1 prenyltransferase [Sulfolobales archaeon]
MASKLAAYWRLFRPRTAVSSLSASLGGALYEGLPQAAEVPLLLLTLAGIGLAHFSVNALNEYVDFKSGLDGKTKRRPFSGGSKVLVDGLLSPREALLAFLLTFLTAFSIGLLLALFRGPLILLFAGGGGAIILGYNLLFVKIGLGEVSVIVKGLLVFLGSSLSVQGTVPLQAVPLGLAYGVLSALVLYANYVADLQEDRSVGRRTLPMFWEKHHEVYMFMIFLYALLITGSTAIGIASPFALLALLPTFYLLLALRGLRRGELEGALSNNVKGCRMADLLLTLSLALRALALR